MNQTADIYTSSSFECKAKLYGSTQIHWKKEGSSRLPSSATITVNTSNDAISSTLKIDEIISFYGGDYYCAVSNEIGEVNSSQAHLHVNSTYVLVCMCPHIPIASFVDIAISTGTKYFTFYFTLCVCVCKYHVANSICKVPN